MLFFQVYLVENFHLRISLLRFSGKYFLTFFLEISFEIFVGTEQKTFSLKLVLFEIRNSDASDSESQSEKSEFIFLRLRFLF